MNTRKTILIASLCAAACALGLAWHFDKSTQASAAAAGLLRQQLAETASRQALLRARLAKADALQQAANAIAPAPQKAARKKDGAPAFLDQLAQNPDLQNRMLAYQRSGLSLKYGALFMRLGLTPEQIAKCEDNLMARAAVDLDLENALRTQGVSLGTPEAGKIREQMLSSYAASQKQLLGEDGAAQLDTYDNNFGWEAGVSGFAGAATVSGVALSADQTRQLLALAVQASHDPGAASGGGVSAAYWASLDSQAAAFLTPAQLSLMKSAEVLGPFGAGSRFQGLLNGAITLGDRADSTPPGGAAR